MYSTIENAIRKLSALDPVSRLDEKKWATFTDVGKVVRPTVSRPAPPVVLRASYDIRSPWRAATRTA